MDLFKALFSTRKTKQLGLPSQLSWSFSQGLWVPYNDKDETYIEKAYKAVPIIQSIVSKIIDKASDAPPQVMRIKNEKAAKGYFLTIKHAKSPEQVFKAKALSVKAFEEVNNHEFLDVMDNPNPIQTGKEIREASMGYLLITGNAIEYAASPNTGARISQPRELWSIPSPCVKPVSGTVRDPIKGYRITYMPQEDIDPSKIMHVKYFNPVFNSNDIIGSYWGLSPLRSGMNLLSQKKYADVTQGTLFANAAPAGIISGNSTDTEQAMTEQQAVHANDHFRKNHMGIHNAGDIFVTPADVKWVNIGLSPVDLDIINFNQDLERQIANIYNWPVDTLQPGGVVSNSEVSARKIITDCVMPLLRRFDDARTRKLREWYKDDSLVYISDLQYYSELSEDREKQAKWLAMCDWLEVDEKRAVMDYGEEYDAKKILVPSGKVPLSDIWSGDLETDDNTEDF